MTTPAGRIDRDGLRGRLILMLAALVTASVLAVGFAAISAFNRAVEPELANRTRLIVTIIRAEIQRALELGIPIDAVAGLDRYLDRSLEQFAEVDRITIATAAGKPVALVERAGAPSLMAQTGLGEVISVRRTTFNLPILHGNRLVAEITVEISPLFVQTRLRDVFLDVLVLALIATAMAQKPLHTVSDSRAVAEPSAPATSRTTGPTRLSASRATIGPRRRMARL